MRSKHRNKNFSLSTSQVQQACFTGIFMIWSPLTLGQCLLSWSPSIPHHWVLHVPSKFNLLSSSSPLTCLVLFGIIISHLGPRSFVPSVTTSAIAHKSLNLEGWSLFSSLFDLVISNSLLLPQPPQHSIQVSFSVISVAFGPKSR